MERIKMSKDPLMDIIGGIWLVVMILLWVFNGIYPGIVLFIIALIVTLAGLFILGGIRAYRKQKREEKE